MKKNQSLGSLAAMVVAAVLIAGAHATLHSQNASAKKPNKGTPARPSGPIVWPLPPEQPRIRYLKTYRGADDFKIRKAPRWKSALLGSDDGGLQPSDTLVKPYGIAVSSTGIVYVADTAARRVFVFDPDRRMVTFIGERGATKLVKPIGVAVDDDGKVFVADASANRVFGYGADGSLAIAIGGAGELKSPSGLALDQGHKRLYVADSSKHQVMCYSTIDGSHVRTIGGRGGDDGQFNFPTNLFIDAEGRLYVTDTLNFRIQIFDAEGRFVRTFGVQGDTAGTLNRPKGIGVDSEGHIYIADTSFNNFQIFDADGQLLLYVGSAGRGPGEFLLPSGLYIDKLDRIYVADQGNSRVQVFQYLRPGSR
jgi:DNA-binding beta-propeller fold protein YncE